LSAAHAWNGAAHASNRAAHAGNTAAHAFAPSGRLPVGPAHTIDEGARVATADARTIIAAARPAITPARTSFATAHASNFVPRETKCTGKSTGGQDPLWSPDSARRKFPVPFTRQEPMRCSGIVTR
jgi:hypothetical protein